MKGKLERQLAERTLSSAQVLDRLTEHANGTVAHFLSVFGDTVVVELNQRP